MITTPAVGTGAAGGGAGGVVVEGGGAGGVVVDGGGAGGVVVEGGGVVEVCCCGGGTFQVLVPGWLVPAWLAAVTETSSRPLVQKAVPAQGKVSCALVAAVCVLRLPPVNPPLAVTA
jgi:hypothetical protein